MKKEIVRVYREKGLNGVYAFLRKEGVKFKKVVYEFGLTTNSEALKDKKDFVNEKELKFHYYNRMVSSKKSGWNYNVARGIELILL